MKLKSVAKKTVILLVIFTLIYSFNPYISVSAQSSEEEGIWFDDFTDLKNFTLEDCDHDEENDLIMLNETEETSYDYDNFPEKVDLWHTEALITDNIMNNILTRFISPKLAPGTESTQSEKNKIGRLDDSAFRTIGRQFSEKQENLKGHPIHHFRFNIARDNKDIQTIVINWYFGEYKEDANLDGISMYVWRYGDIIPIWGLEETIDYENANIANNIDEPDITTQVEIKQLSEEGYLDIIVIGIPTLGPAPSYLYTNYIKLDIQIEKGYFPKGTITQKGTIKPNNFGRWDRIIWAGSRSTTKSNITIQVLDKNGDLIKEFESMESPMDISSLEENEIKIKAILRSGSIEKTPKLDSIGVLWQDINGFNDSFSNNFRIDQMEGLENINGEIKVDKFYSNWPIFGKNSHNTRSYDGNSIKNKPSDYFWYSKLNQAGGGFRAPVVSDNKLFVASHDKRIYSYPENTIASSPIDKLEMSEPSYVVDSSLAVEGDNIIFGTSELNSVNGIYVLDKENLSEKWSYKINDDGNICFSAPPTIDDGRVFITSWSGNFWNIPLLSFLNEFITGNNKLISLDLEAKDTLWEPVDLPAGSVSSPAVGEKNVFVGCQNMYGGNLYAFDIDTGEEIWNKTLGNPYGIIGKSSPVYSDGKVFILCNEREALNSNGINKIFALDSNNGNILWNQSIGEPKLSALLQLVKGYNFYKNIASAAPISSPAVYNGKIYVLSPSGSFYCFNSNSGDVEWSYDFTNKSLSASYYVTSPVVIHDKIYVTTGNILHCFDINQKNEAEVDWSLELKSPGEFWVEAAPEIISSPVFSDGLLFISATTDNSNLSGRILCLGEYKTNSNGFVKSTPIHLPKGFWWNNFSAVNTTTNTKNNTISYSILNKNGAIIEEFGNLNGKNNDISDLNTNVIKLYARLSISNNTETIPSLDSWSVDWVEEKAAPEFDWSETDGWVNRSIPDFSVIATDKADNGVLSGLDVSTAQYRISYIPEGKDKAVYSKWFSAACNKNPGCKSATVTAKISEAGLNIKALYNITFKICDLAGNTATETIPLNTDTEVPSSIIENYDELNDGIFNTYPLIDITYTDEGGSDIRRIYLNYKYSSNSSNGPWTNWTEYSNATSLFSWEFGEEDSENLESGFYQVVSIAVDKAGNTEKITDEKIVTFLFDLIKPSIDTDIKDIYKSREVPSFNFDISDDYKLDSFLYRFDINESWSIIKEEIYEKSNSTEWRFPENYWANLEDEDQYIVFFNVTDIAGNSYEASTIVKKDENATLPVIDISGWNIGDTYTISLNNIPSDMEVDKAILLYKYSKDNKEWDENWTQYKDVKTSSPYEWNFKPEESGYYTFKVKIKDASGAISYSSATEEKQITIMPIVETILFIILVILSLITSIFIIRKISRKKTF